MFSKKKFIKIFEVKNNEPVFIREVAKILDADYGFTLEEAINTIPHTLEGDAYGEEYTRRLLDQVPDNFCLYPFSHFQLDPDGRGRPCCKYRIGDSTWQNSVPKLPDVNIGDLWEQVDVQKLRSQFLNNERPSGCKACWDEEDAGILSMRLQRERGGKESPHSTFFDYIPTLYPKTLDFKLSNLCNLKCRICTPFLSSQWIKEATDLKIIDIHTKELHIANSKEKFSADPANQEILKLWSSNIHYLEFYGGEPLMQQEHNDILGIVKEFGDTSQIGLYYNTNSTICNEDLFKVWANFKEVIINFSIDDLDKRFEYQRKNAKWIETLSIIENYKELSKKYNVNMVFRIYTTVGILNVFYLKEFFEYINSFDMKVVLNLVHYPPHYSIINLPPEVKDIVKHKLLEIKSTSIDNYSASIDNIINYMYGQEFNPSELKEFFRRTKMHDTYRNESFNETFPELYNLLKEYDE